MQSAFVVLIILRFASLALRSIELTLETTEAPKGEVAPMVRVKAILSIVTETALALGTSTLAGLPLFT
jgi:hypothetical protein